MSSFSCLGNLCQQGCIPKGEPLGNPPPQLKSSMKPWPPLQNNSVFILFSLLAPFSIPSLPTLLPLPSLPLCSPFAPSLFYISLRLQCVFEEDLADVFDELTANLQVCAKNQGEKERKLKWREREKESGERK